MTGENYPDGHGESRRWDRQGRWRALAGGCAEQTSVNGCEHLTIGSMCLDLWYRSGIQRGSYRRILGCRPLFELNRVGRTGEIEAGRSNVWKERTSELKKAGRYPKDIFDGRCGDPLGVDRNGRQPTVCLPGRRISNGTGGSEDFRATRRPGGRGLQRGRYGSAATGLFPISPYPSSRGVMVFIFERRNTSSRIFPPFFRLCAVSPDRVSNVSPFLSLTTTYRRMTQQGRFTSRDMACSFLRNGRKRKTGSVGRTGLHIGPGTWDTASPPMNLSRRCSQGQGRDTPWDQHMHPIPACFEEIISHNRQYCEDPGRRKSRTRSAGKGWIPHFFGHLEMVVCPEFCVRGWSWPSRVQGMVNKGKMPGHCVIGAVMGFSCPMGEGSNDHFGFRSRCIPGSMP